MVATYLVAYGIAAALALVLTPTLRRYARSRGLLDHPGWRKVHTRPVPRIGGVAIFGSTLVGFTVAAVAVGADRMLAATMVGGAIVFAIGLYDDISSRSVPVKAAVQVVAAGVVIAVGVRITGVPFNDAVHDLGILTIPATVVWIVGVTNAFNLIDGLDGLATGLAIIAGTACSVVLVQRGDVGAVLLLASMLGALSGFLVFNFSPASIFLGDGGSFFVGYMLSVVAVMTWQPGDSAGTLGVPLLAFCLPVTDTLLSIARRVWAAGFAPSSNRTTPTFITCCWPKAGRSATPCCCSTRCRHLCHSSH